MLVLDCRKNTHENDGMLKTFIELAIGHIENLIRLEEVKEINQINKFKTIQKTLGKNPNRYRISSEALFRRIASGKGISSINPIIDFNNYMSLYSFLPCGCYDSTEIQGNVIMRRGAKDENIPTLSKGNFNVEGSVVLSDFLGVFGSPINDSVRSKITPKTDSFYMIFYSATEINSQKILKEFDKVAKFAGVELLSSQMVG